MFKLKSNVEVEKIEDETIIVDVNNGKFIRLNVMSTILLENITKFKIELIALKMEEKYEIPLNKCTQIITNFINELLELELIEKV